VSTAPTSTQPVLGGVIPILVTPFRPDGSIDLAQLDRELDFLMSAGIDWVGFGFGSEVPRLDPDELATTIAHAVGHVEGRMGIIGNAEMTSARSGTTGVRRVAETGAAMAMVRPSLLAGIGGDALFDTFAEVATNGELPIIVQDAPQNTGVLLPAPTLARMLAEIPGVTAVKVEPPAPAPKISAVVQALAGRPGTIIGGVGGVDFVHERQRGAAGTMPGPAYPEVFALAAAQLDRGERAAAFVTHGRLLPLITLCSRDMDTFLFVQKHVLRRRGVLDEPFLRSPHLPLEPGLASEVDALLEDLGLLEFFDACATQLQADREVAARVR
jgi:dihydrodipicolinate synthase/N-acetylneuraminate lyase